MADTMVEHSQGLGSILALDRNQEEQFGYTQLSDYRENCGDSRFLGFFIHLPALPAAARACSC